MFFSLVLNVAERPRDVPASRFHEAAFIDDNARHNNSSGIESSGKSVCANSPLGPPLLYGDGKPSYHGDST